MIIELCAIGKFKASEPEQKMAIDYLERANNIGRNIALSPVRLHEIDARTTAPNPEKEAQLFMDYIPASAFVIVLDETGENLRSMELSERITKLRDNGTKQLVFAIGGADGHGKIFKNRANLLISFGKLTWPHKLCRTMAAEQIYRALSITANLPYHRD